MKRLKQVDYIVLHCTGTAPNYSLESIRHYHVDILKWSAVGYHFIVSADGTIYQFRSLDVCGSHVKGYNNCSVGVAYVGGLLNGVFCDTRTPEQIYSLHELYKYLHFYFPYAELKPHSFFNSSKACPCLSELDMSSEISYFGDCCSDFDFVTSFPLKIHLYE